MKACLAIGALALILVPALAAAQDPRRRPPPPVYEPGARAFPPYTPFRGPQGQLCVAWCPEDLNPCDPPVFKQADGRCMRND
jgi:hypothetical protein